MEVRHGIIREGREGGRSQGDVIVHHTNKRGKDNRDGGRGLCDDGKR